jgi:UDP-N-acetylglucosamine 2-epimerase (non-hydrolysing)
MERSPSTPQLFALSPGLIDVDTSPGKIAVVFGTRPEIIKLAPVIHALRRHHALSVRIINSNQHDTLLDPFLDLLNINADHELRVMREGQSPSEVCSRVLASLDPILCEERPDLVLVQGDTTTALAGALTAFHCGIAVGHIEAGLRSNDVTSPFPEEMNRQLISRLSTYHFAATASNKENLIREGIAASNVFVTGNPVVDALMSFLGSIEMGATLQGLLDSTASYRRVVLTTHRRESFGTPLLENLGVLRAFVEEQPGVVLIFPVHPNPAVKQAAARLLSGHPRIHLIEPLAYDQFICLLRSAWLIVSDSGGVQEEAPTLGKPLLVLRKNTERPEAMSCGIARLVGGSASLLSEALNEAVRPDNWTERVSAVANPFGDGKSGSRIASIVLDRLIAKNISPTFAI